MARMIIGVDIGGTKCAALLASVDGGIRVADRRRFPTETAFGFDRAWERMIAAIDDLLKSNAVAPEEIAAIGVSCGSPLDSGRGIIQSPPNLPGWDDIHITQMLTERYHAPAFLQNDANACALVEWTMGAGRGTRNMVFLTMGTGMGAGIIAEGQLINGACGNAGEVGHIRLANDGPVGYGKSGSFEGFCSGGGIERFAESMTADWLNAGITPAWVIANETPSARLLADYARKGDAQALTVLSNVAKRLGQGIAALIDALNPELIVIGSIFTRSGELLREEMEAVISRECLPSSRAACRVVEAETGDAIGDLASCVVACQGIGIDPLAPAGKDDEAFAHMASLLSRYPDLAPLKQSVKAAYEMLAACFDRNGKVLLCGNGGSAADCEHIVGELMKGFMKPRSLPAALADAIDESFKGVKANASASLQRALPAIALTQHSALSTAFSNDVDPSMVFAQQVIGYGARGDVLIAISTSGNSNNVVNAALTARALDMRCIALTGPGGGRLAEIADVLIAAPGSNTAEVQERHLPIYHTLCAMLESRFF